MGIHAVINGKVSSTGSNLSQKLEDLMTSNLFQNLLYLPYNKGLFPVISHSINHLGRKLALPENMNIEKFQFWPKWDSCEPDLVLSFIQTETKKKINVLIEAKLYSALSGQNQLVRELSDFNKAFPDEDNYLIYLNAETYFPKIEFNQSKKLDKSVNLEKFYWLTYEGIHKAINIPENRKNLILSNILQLLEYYYFVPFEKWSEYRHINYSYKTFIKNDIQFNKYNQVKSKYNPVWTTIKS